MDFILDYSKWRCGGDDSNKLGEGETLLLNKEGYQCCLGQFCSQLGFELGDLYDKTYPSEIEQKQRIPSIGIFTSDFSDFGDTDLTDAAVAINDNIDTTPQEKIDALKELFSEHGHTITVINQPKDEQTNTTNP
jgi:hypothetical protein